MGGVGGDSAREERAGTGGDGTEEGVRGLTKGGQFVMGRTRVSGVGEEQVEVTAALHLH